MTVTLAAPTARTAWPAPDEDQARAIAHRGPALLVRGAAGTGRTTTALALVAERVTAGELRADEVLVLAPTRRAAARLRDDLSARLRRTTGQPVVRTAASAAFSVLRARASLLGEPAPTLISGPEQDLVLAELLAGHAEGEGARVVWPARVPAGALGLRAFRDELRDLLMRAAERGLRPAELARLGEEHARPEWVAAAAVYAEYLDVTRLRSGTPDAGARYDAAVVVDEAAEALRAWDAEVPGAPRPGWRLVVVDDYQEATAATARLLHVLADGGADLVLLADPDAAVQTFRGATPALTERAVVGPAGSELGAFGADEVVLRRVWRHGAAVRRVVRAVTDEIRGPGRAHREALAATAADGDVAVRFLRSPAQEAAYVAHALRAAHLHDGVPWSRMAVVVRSGAHVTELRRALLAAQVPAAVVGSDVALRAEPAVRPLLLALGVALDPAALDAAVAAELLVSPLGGTDAVGLRRLRRALRAEELAGDGTRTSDPLLMEVLAVPERAATLPAAVRRPVQRLAAVLRAGREAASHREGTVLDVLWALWSTADLAEAWRRRALAGGPGGARADRDLDAVLALFAAAEQFVDRLPMAPPAAFLEHLGAQDLPADSLAAQADVEESVPVLTAAAAAGGEWDVCVVAGVQEGVWPDLRLRDSLLGAQHLVEVLAGRAVGPSGAPAVSAEARAAVLDDELRAFAVALSRARRRVLVTAVQDTDHQPSGLIDLVDPGPDEAGEDRRLVTVPSALDLRAVVARCRSVLERAVAEALDEAGAPDGVAASAHPAAVLLARLAAEGVPGADPATWYGVGPSSTDAPLWPADAAVPLSPSKLEAAATCALRWALEAAGGTAADSGEQSLGTLVHAVAAALPEGDEAELAALLDERWGELGLGDGWVGAVQRRRADAMIRLLAAYLRGAGEVLAVEEPFAVDVGRVRLRGTVDRLERLPDADDGTPRARVVDLKTGRSAVTADAVARHAQLGAYQVSLDAGAFAERTGGARSGGAALVYVGTGTQRPSLREQVAVADDAEPGWAEALLDEVAATVSASAVAATANDLCRTCAVRRSCPVQPEGRVVGA
ncbi:ATP-dependent helicase [Actinotalea solisilvae]|uniref:ATP-dependent helicase n=1 Tax=Actinotalea solisilvae TaxID=2072922 RepID=UPI0018F22119|nr:ATP-dependent DNA helicase [Actinotalea solisilvae]